MSFSALPSSQENERYFRIQDPFGLRRSIVPLFTIDSGNTSGFWARNVFPCGSFWDVFNSLSSAGVSRKKTNY